MPTTIEATVNTAKTTEAAASEDASDICTLIEALVLKDTVDLKNKIWDVISWWSKAMQSQFVVPQALALGFGTFTKKLISRDLKLKAGTKRKEKDEFVWFVSWI